MFVPRGSPDSRTEVSCRLFFRWLARSFNHGGLLSASPLRATSSPAAIHQRSTSRFAPCLPSAPPTLPSQSSANTGPDIHLLHLSLPPSALSLLFSCFAHQLTALPFFSSLQPPFPFPPFRTLSSSSASVVAVRHRHSSIHKDTHPPSHSLSIYTKN